MARLYCWCLYKEKCMIRCPKCGRNNSFSKPDGRCICGEWDMATTDSTDFCAFDADITKWQWQVRPW